MYANTTNVDDFVSFVPLPPPAGMPLKKKTLQPAHIAAEGAANLSQLSAATAAVAEADKKTVVQFTDAETTELLNIIKKKKPIGMEGWREV